jgi:hypothetical protein
LLLRLQRPPRQVVIQGHSPMVPTGRLPIKPVRKQER